MTKRQVRRREAVKAEMRKVNSEFGTVVHSRHGEFLVYTVPRKARRRIARRRAKRFINGGG